MAINGPFQPTAPNTISLTTSGVASTSQTRQITPQNLGLLATNPFPPCVRIVNKGTSDIWLSFTVATAVIVIPTPGTTTVGTPQPVFISVAGSIEVLTVSPGPTLFVQDISTGTSQTYHLIFGEGI